ncbi:MAG: hypothetical protein ACTSRZ_01605 [Promethearchaeota archaeon]
MILQNQNELIELNSKSKQINKNECCNQRDYVKLKNKGITIATFLVWHSAYNEEGELEPIIEKMDIETFLNAKCHTCKHKVGFYNLDGYGFFETENCKASIDGIIAIGMLNKKEFKEKCNFKDI